MADISSIKLNDTTYNIKDNNAVSKNDIIDVEHGGTSASTAINARHTLGVQAVQQVQANGGVAYKLTGDGVNGFIFTVMRGAASLNCICLVDIWNDIKYIGSFPSWLIIVKNTDDNSVIIQRSTMNTASCIITAIGATIEEVAYDANRVTTNINPIVIPIEQGGTNATTAANAIANLGAVSKSGDTMTGLLKLSNAGMEMFSEAGYTIDQYGNFMHKRNTADDVWNFKNNAGTATVKMYFENGKIIANGDIESVNGSINVNTSNNGTYRGFRVSSGDGYCAILNTGKRLTFDQYLHGSTGGERFLLPIPDSRSSDAWYAILTSKSPVTTAQGGTGGGDSGDVSCTLGSGLTGEMLVRSLGKIVHFGMKLTTTGSLSANQSWTFGTIPSGYRPKWNITIPAGDRNRWGSLLIGANGTVIYYNCSSAITANTTIYAYTFYLIA